VNVCGHQATQSPTASGGRGPPLGPVTSHAGRLRTALWQARRCDHQCQCCRRLRARVVLQCRTQKKARRKDGIIAEKTPSTAPGQGTRTQAIGAEGLANGTRAPAVGAGCQLPDVRLRALPGHFSRRGDRKSGSRKRAKNGQRKDSSRGAGTVNWGQNSGQQRDRTANRQSCTRSLSAQPTVRSPLGVRDEGRDAFIAQGGHGRRPSRKPCRALCYSARGDSQAVAIRRLPGEQRIAFATTERDQARRRMKARRQNQSESGSKNQQSSTMDQPPATGVERV